MNSLRLFAGTDGCTAMMLVATVMRATGVRSFCAQGSFCDSAGLPTWYAE